MGVAVWAKSLMILKPPMNKNDFPSDGLVVDVDTYREGVLRVNAVRPFLLGAVKVIDNHIAATANKLLGVE
jgi:hypothetical protein